MLKITLSLMTAIIMSMMVMILCSLISKKTIIDREKMSPFECGFDPKSSSRLPFSSQFFLIAVLFLIFDIEIVIILPMVITMKTSNMMNWFITSSMFITILIMGLYHEWKNGILEWAK
uniref:NADH-ubiquinone oxidoreductase chain 3 n=1 Tax=Adelphocoris lineolatus TaxID=236346 RepID=A0A0F6MXX7_ADELI|nr:NADH dehydrogenase subunit 3 [Adelphocoris lineolatus]AHL44248.1 NADH dehydrogenase subunit 3 [Adelphocoris lineolatus]ANT45797.1 NADH dehydrogenase subunit 3 [Adelphocoris lineolatus]